MKRAYLLPAAYTLDQLAGDPEWFPHPVRVMGFATARGERLLRGAESGRCRQLVAGAALTFGVVGASYWLTRTAVRLTYGRSRMLGAAVEIALGWTCLAARNLQDEAGAVCAALEGDALAAARMRVARIVGRDTDALDASEISRAVIETLAESACDGVVAPLLYLAAGGVPLAMAYKAVNTLDSMIGHRDERYLYFGKAAARLDDVANYLPARVTALAVVAAAALSSEGDARAAARQAWAVWRADGAKHKSPNAGQPEAAMAGALKVRLGGGNRYGGEWIAAPAIGSGFPAATPADARRALRLTAKAALIGLLVAVVVARRMR